MDGTRHRRITDRNGIYRSHIDCRASKARGLRPIVKFAIVSQVTRHRCLQRARRTKGRVPDGACPRGLADVGEAVDTDSAGQKQSDRRSDHPPRSEEHTSELQSLMRISYAVFCLKKKTKNT